MSVNACVFIIMSESLEPPPLWVSQTGDAYTSLFRGAGVPGRSSSGEGMPPWLGGARVSGRPGAGEGQFWTGDGCGRWGPLGGDTNTDGDTALPSFLIVPYPPACQPRPPWQHYCPSSSHIYLGSKSLFLFLITGPFPTVIMI